MRYRWPGDVWGAFATSARILKPLSDLES
jgi:hypothetical protein